MSIQHTYISDYGPTVSGRNRGTLELRTGHWSKHHDDDADDDADDQGRISTIVKTPLKSV